MPRPNNPTDHPGPRLRAAREERGLSLREAAKLAGVSHQFWDAIEAGRKGATLDTLHALATAIGADPHELDERLKSTEG